MQSLRRLSLAPALVLSLLGLPALAQSQVTTVPSALNFQGRLANPSGNPVADGTYSVRFSLWDAVTAGTEKYSKTIANVVVKNGTFAITLDAFPAGTFDGNLWLEIKIGSDAALTPRTPLVSVPYAIKSDIALTVPDGSLTASKFAAGELSNAVNSLAWLLGGNAGTNPASQFLGTTDAQPLVFKTSNAERLRIDPFGRVGIGTDTPLVALDVAGEIRTSSVLSLRRNDPNGIISYLPQGGTGAHEWWVGAMRSGSGIAPAGSFAFFDQTAGATRLTLDGNGNVGIGTNNPQAKLQVNGSVRMDGNNVLELGGGTTKQNDAGKIGYQTFTSDALDIIGAGTLSNNRKIKFWAEGGTTFTGGIGIGTSTPIQALDVNGRINVANGVIQKGGSALTSTTDLGLYANSGWIRFVTNNANFAWFADGGAGNTPIMTLLNNGNLGVGTGSPQQKLDVNGGINVANGIIQRGGTAITNTADLGLYSQISGAWVRFVTNNSNFAWYADSGAGTTPIMTLNPSGELTAKVVTITGGSDVAEPYHVANAGEVNPLPGMVVSIDPDQIGQMRVASRAYDSTVAGIISGANGISPGITLRQKGTIADGEYPVASIGRVWVLCDTDATGSIAPGDLLTTSDTPGHAMKATDRERRDGAIIGKAMSPLKSGKGMVLVLVSLK